MLRKDVAKQGLEKKDKRRELDKQDPCYYYHPRVKEQRFFQAFAERKVAPKKPAPLKAIPESTSKQPRYVEQLFRLIDRHIAAKLVFGLAMCH